MTDGQVVWTSKAKKRTEPRRGSKPGKRIARNAEETWKEVRKIWALIEEPCKAAVKARMKSQGEVTVDMKLTDAAVARLQHQKSPPAPYDPIVEGATRGLFEYASWKNHMNTIDALTEHWLAVGGATLAVEALSEAPKYWWAFDHALLAVRHSLGGGDGYLDMHIGPWRIVRAELATLDDASYAAVRAVAAKRFDAGDLGVKSSIAFAFPAETKWVAEAVSACLAHKSTSTRPRCMTPLLAAVTDAKLAAQIVKRAPWGLEWCPSLVDGIGADAAPLLIEIFAEMSRVPERRQALESLALIQTPEVAAHFAALTEDKPLRATVFAYFSSAPELARAALAPVVAKAGAKSEAAKILAQLSG